MRLAPTPTRAETRCQAPHDSEQALAATDGRVRLQWIDLRLTREAHRMSWWNWGWAIGIGASGVGSLAAVPVRGARKSRRLLHGRGLAALGMLPFVLAPPDVIHDGRELHARLLGTPPGTDTEVCAMLADAETRLVRDARNERLLSGWWSHAANVAINAGAFFFLGFGYHHWLSGTINGASASSSARPSSSPSRARRSTTSPATSAAISAQISASDLISFGDAAGVAKRYTQRTQNPPPARAYEFKSRLRHQQNN